MNHNKKFLIVAVVLLAILILVCTFIYLNFFATYNLIFLNDGQPIIYSDTYMDITAVISDDGNCYIRGYPISKTSPYGVRDIAQYNNQYNSLNFNNANRFVQIYANKDAARIDLSGNGGTIITNTHDLYVFADTEEFLTPSFVCSNVTSAKLFKKTLYILFEDGVLGYCDLANPLNVNVLKKDVCDFQITDLDGGSLWFLTKENKLWVYDIDENIATAELCADEVSAFSVLCTENNHGLQPNYILGYISNTGEVFLYNYRGIYSIGDKKTALPVSGDPSDIVAYREGVIVLNTECEAFVFGKDLLGTNKYFGNAVVNNIVAVSADLMNINFVNKGGELVVCGHLPNSTFVYFEEIAVVSETQARNSSIQ